MSIKTIIAIGLTAVMYSGAATAVNLKFFKLFNKLDNSSPPAGYGIVQRGIVQAGGPQNDESPTGVSPEFCELGGPLAGKYCEPTAEKMIDQDCTAMSRLAEFIVELKQKAIDLDTAKTWLAEAAFEADESVNVSSDSLRIADAIYRYAGDVSPKDYYSIVYHQCIATSGT